MKIGIGEDAHQFEKIESGKKCVVGGVIFTQEMGLDADSDGDVVYHALCNALTCIHHVPILGGAAQKICQEGQQESGVYVKQALKHLEAQSIDHVSFSIEASRPRMQEHILQMRKNVAKLLAIPVEKVGMVCTSGNKLSFSAEGRGIRALCTLIVG